MIEIGWFASENGDKDFEKWVTNQTESMVRVCRFLNLGNKQNIIPRWSDISPDYPPQWLFGYPFTMNYSEESDLSPWAKIWGDLYTTKKSKSYHYDLRKINSKNQYGHWIKYELKPFKILLVADLIISDLILTKMMEVFVYILMINPFLLTLDKIAMFGKAKSLSNKHYQAVTIQYQSMT